MNRFPMLLQRFGVSQSIKSRPTSTHQEIADTIRQIMQRIHDALETEELSGAKDCVIDYLIKRLALSEIVFMIQCYKFNLLALEQSKSIDVHNLVDIQVAGHA